MQTGKTVRCLVILLCTKSTSVWVVRRQSYASVSLRESFSSSAQRLVFTVFSKGPGTGFRSGSRCRSSLKGRLEKAAMMQCLYDCIYRRRVAHRFVKSPSAIQSSVVSCTSELMHSPVDNPISPSGLDELRWCTKARGYFIRAEANAILALRATSTRLGAPESSRHGWRSSNQIWRDLRQVRLGIFLVVLD